MIATLHQSSRIDKSSGIVANMSTEKTSAEARSIADQVGMNLAERRSARGMSLRELSALLDQIDCPVNPDGLNRIEKGRRKVTADELVALAIALRVTPNRLLLPADDTENEEIALTPSVVLTSGMAWHWADGRGLPARLVGAVKPDAVGRDVFAAGEDFRRDARPRSERVREVQPASKAARDLLDRIHYLIEWMEEYERDREGAPAYDYLGLHGEQVELAAGRLQADLAELLSTARRLRAETTPTGTPMPPQVGPGGDDGR